jgi:hypothetical protein
MSAMDSQERYLYLKIDCKTKGCETACVLKFLGPYFGQGKISDLIPEWFDYQCHACGQTQRYQRSDVRPIVSDDPPPSEFQDAF